MDSTLIILSNYLEKKQCKYSLIFSLSVLLIILPISIYSQVGINKNSPATTLDVEALQSKGTYSNVDGILIPRIDRQRAQSMVKIPISNLIYVNDISTGTQSGITTNMDTTGYYYYNGTEWAKLNTNIYETDGKLSGNRNIDLNGNTLSYTAGTSINAFSVNGNAFSIDAKNNRVGIGTTTPSSTLDINGTLKVNELADGVSDTYFLTSDDKGNIKKIDRNELTEKIVVTLEPEQSVTVTNTKNYPSSNIMIASINACNRYMASSFQSSYGALVFLNGVARSVLAQYTATQSSYSVIWNINFPNVPGCADGGNGSQFDYIFTKTNSKDYAITNKGNVKKSYTITFQKI